MKTVMQKLHTLSAQACAFWADTRGVTAIEYGVLAASIAIGVGALFSGDGGFMEALKGTFGTITEQLQQSAQ